MEKINNSLSICCEADVYSNISANPRLFYCIECHEEVLESKIVEGRFYQKSTGEKLFTNDFTMDTNTIKRRNEKIKTSKICDTLEEQIRIILDSKKRVKSEKLTVFYNDNSNFCLVLEKVRISDLEEAMNDLKKGIQITMINFFVDEMYINFKLINFEESINFNFINIE